MNDKMVCWLQTEIHRRKNQDIQFSGSIAKKCLSGFVHHQKHKTTKQGTARGEEMCFLAYAGLVAKKCTQVRKSVTKEGTQTRFFQ